ncbi:MAG TPA: serine protease [Terriglobales bacterium]|nr:serine protease [Terriglobales bacterium]
MRTLRIAWQVVPWIFVALLIVQIYPSRVTTMELNGAVSQLNAQLSQLRSEQEMPATVLKRHRNAICYIYAVYTMEWPSRSIERRLERHTRVSGTGFLVADDLIATNRHVVEPWFEDDDDQDQIKAGAKPKLEKLVAFFPGMMDPVKLGNIRVSMDQDLAVAKLIEGPLPSSIQPLPIAAELSQPGDPVIVIGYPLGVSAMLAKTPSNLYKRLASTKDTGVVANELAAHALIRPSATCGHLGDIVDEKMIYDAPTAQGGSGGPVFNSRGEVIAVNSAYIDGFNGGTIGISATALHPLIAAASHRSPR